MQNKDFLSFFQIIFITSIEINKIIYTFDN